MKYTDVKNETQLWDFMTSPSEQLKQSVAGLAGPIMVLGGSGKMGVELVGLIQRADQANAQSREIIVASTFSNPQGVALSIFKKMGVKCYRGDLSDPAFLTSLPVVPNVIYMMGFKFGSSGHWQKSFHLNSIVPYQVGQHYRDSKIVVFSSGNPYPHSSMHGKGCSEKEPLDPLGIYGWSIVARESSFAISAAQNPNQKSCLFRLMYAQHLAYGVLIDLARMVLQQEPISLAMPAVNLVSQRDANEVAIRSFEYCSNEPWVLNVAGPICPVREVVSRLESHLDIQANLLENEQEEALLANDDLCVSTFGAYRDEPEEMILAAANWVKNGGVYWNKPTHFGKVAHDY